MIPLLLFLLGCAAVYVASVSAALTVLARLSHRFAMERRSGADALSRSLDDPIRIQLPARLWLSGIYAVAALLLAWSIGLDTPRRVASFLGAAIGFAVVCEQLVPLIIVRRDPERVLELLLPSFTALARLLRPLNGPLGRLAASARRESREGGPRLDPQATEASPVEVDEAVGEADGAIEHEERRLLKSIVDFGGTLVREVMTPRPDIVSIHAGASIDELRALFAEQEYSRFPVTRDGLDDIAGFLFVKDLINLSETDASAGIRPLIRPAYFVPESKLVAELLREFQQKQVQSAIVLDEYGGTAGLVTFEDLLEEIVGEIRDEYDVEADLVVEESGGSVVFSGKVSIVEVVNRLGVAIERDGFETVGGWLLKRVGRVPTVGETFDLDGLRVDVLEAERRRVQKVRVSPADRAPAASNGT